MPEGDTIHRLAATIRPVLLDRKLVRADLPRLTRQIPEQSVVSEVEARGKHLLMHFSDELTLHSHMRMNGTWVIRPIGQRLGASRTRIRALLRTQEHRVVCLDAPVVELLDTAALATHPVLRRLGPDLLADACDIDVVLVRGGREQGDALLVDALLNQTIAAGIGNVYASELAHLAGLHPATAWSDVPIDLRRSLFLDARRLLLANLSSARRSTVPDAPAGSLWVYDRAGRPCRRCGDAIEVARLGRGARPTYWCPTCQTGRPSPMQRARRLR